MLCSREITKKKHRYNLQNICPEGFSFRVDCLPTSQKTSTGGKSGRNIRQKENKQGSDSNHT